MASKLNKMIHGWSFEQSRKINNKFKLNDKQLMNFFSSSCHKVFGSVQYDYPKVEGSCLVWKTRLKPHVEFRLCQTADGSILKLRADYFNKGSFLLFASVYYIMMHMFVVGGILQFMNAWLEFSETISKLLSLLFGWIGMLLILYIIYYFKSKNRKQNLPAVLDELETSFINFFEITSSSNSKKEIRTQELIDCIPELSIGRPGIYNINLKKWTDKLKVTAELKNKDISELKESLKDSLDIWTAESQGFIIDCGYEEDLEIIFVPRTKGLEIEIHSDTSGRVQSYLMYLTLALISIFLYAFGHGYVKIHGAGQFVTLAVTMGLGTIMLLSILIAYLDRIIRKYFRLHRVKKGLKKLL